MLKGYEKLVEDYGYRNMCLVNRKDNALLIAVYAAIIVLDSSENSRSDMINIDQSLKVGGCEVCICNQILII